MTKKQDDPSREIQEVGLKFLALQALHDLSQDVLAKVGDEHDADQASLNDIEAFDAALRRRNFATPELLAMQDILAGRLQVIARLLRQQYRLR
jgi:hypothetical protein